MVNCYLDGVLLAVHKVGFNNVLLISFYDNDGSNCFIEVYDYSKLIKDSEINTYLNEHITIGFDFFSITSCKMENGFILNSPINIDYVFSLKTICLVNGQGYYHG